MKNRDSDGLKSGGENARETTQRPEYILKILEGRDKKQQLVTGKRGVLQVIDLVSYV